MALQKITEKPCMASTMTGTSGHISNFLHLHVVLYTTKTFLKMNQKNAECLHNSHMVLQMDAQHSHSHRADKHPWPLRQWMAYQLY